MYEIDAYEMDIFFNFGTQCLNLEGSFIFI